MGKRFAPRGMRKPFKACPMCKFTWLDPADFIKDTGLRGIGSLLSIKAEGPSSMIFIHSCGAVLSAMDPEPPQVAIYNHDNQPVDMATDS